MSDSKLRVDERQVNDVTVLVLAGEMLLDMATWCSAVTFTIWWPVDE